MGTRLKHKNICRRTGRLLTTDCVSDVLWINHNLKSQLGLFVCEAIEFSKKKVESCLKKMKRQKTVACRELQHLMLNSVS